MSTSFSYLTQGKTLRRGTGSWVLEWIPETLEGLLREADPADQDSPSFGWDNFAEVVALPLLRALSFAHENDVAHRDVKPSNVLVTDKGTIKLGDFGISKIKGSLEPSKATLAGYMSRPFAPPESDSTSAYTRDVFSYGVLILDCWSEARIEDYPDIPTALQRDMLDVPPEVARLLEEATALDPRDRPANAIVLLAQLEGVQRRRPGSEKPRKVYLELTGKVRQNVSTAAGESMPLGESEVDRMIGEDLVTFATEQMTDYESGKLLPADFWLYGERFRFHAKPADDVRRMLLVGAQEKSSGALDAARERAWSPPFELVVGHPLDYREASAALEALRSGLDSFHAHRSEEAERNEQARLFREWFGQLRALSDYEMKRTPPIPIVYAELQGRRAKLTLRDVPENDPSGQRRAIAIGGIRLSGDVEEVDGKRVVLYLDKTPKAIPSGGRLVADDTATQIGIERQRKALHAVRDRSGLVQRPDLRDLILDPSRCRTPAPSDASEDNGELHADKRAAIASALGAQDMFLVEGPPGTGKTTLIVGLVRQVLKADPNARVLLASQTHVALDNALERLDATPEDWRLIRIGRPGDPRVSSEVKGLLLDNQLASWAESTRKRSEKWLADWAGKRGLDARRLRRALAIRELAALKSEYEQARSSLERLKVEATDGGLSAEEREVRDLQLANAREQQKRRRQEIDRVITDLARQKDLTKNALKRASAEEVAQLDETESATDEESIHLRNLLRLQADWHLRLGRSPDFEEALLVGSQVVAGTCVGLLGPRSLSDVSFTLCILDEASKATATQSIVPMSRANRWVLVGDPRQLPPFQEEALHDPEVIQEYGLDRAELERSLFDRFLDGVPEACRAQLSTQHRMTPAIAELISDCFYDSTLQSAADVPRPELGFALHTPIVWKDTSGLSSRRERRAGRFSFMNREEVAQVGEFLKTLAFVLANTHRDSTPALSVMTLSGYRPQVEAIQRHVSSISPHLRGLDLQVRTVDEVQGREADVVVFSLTRSNTEGRPGFLALTNRINVALSRARIGLVIVGDLPFAESTGGPLARVVSFMEQHPGTCTIERLGR